MPITAETLCPSTKLVDEGVWFTVLEDADGSKFEIRLRPWFYGPYERARDAALAKNRADLTPDPTKNGEDAGALIERRQRVLAPIVAEYLAVDWRGLVEGGGSAEPVPFSAEALANLLITSPILRPIVFSLIESWRAFSLDREQADERRLGSSSVGA